MPVVSRRRAMSALLACGLPSIGLAQRDYPGLAYRQYFRVLPDYLGALAKDAYERRERAIAALKTPEAIQKRQQWTRDTFWKLTGGRPEPTPLNIRTHGGFERDGYRVEKLTYESRPGLIIPANLYIPAKARGPFPGVLFQLGHSLNGKSADPYQRCCQGLAKLGYLVLAFDPMGQGERTYYPRPGGTLTRLSSADDEHTLPGRQMLLLGDTSTRMQTWDAVRSLDVLASHPLVDPKRLATTGQSGGGTLSMMLAAVDDRLAVAAVSSGNTENIACRNFNSPGSTDDAEQNFVASGPEGFDRWDLLYPLAPKPLLVLVSARDYFGTYSHNYLSSGWEEYQKLEAVYRTLGHEDKIAWGDTPLPHGLSYALRLKIYNWFARWLKNSNETIEREPPVQIEPDETLWVGRTGNAVRDFASTTPHRMVQELLSKTQPDRTPIPKRNMPTSSMKTLAKVPSGNLTAEAVEFTVNGSVYLPAWLFVPRNPRAVLLISEPSGRSTQWHEGRLYPSLADEGVAVCAVDVRGIGDLRPEYPRGQMGHASYHVNEENYAWASLILGHTLLEQRVDDLTAAASALQRRFSGLPLRLAASGRMTVPALFAAAQFDEIASLYLSRGLVSFRNIVETEEYTHTLANFIPSILRHRDLPDIAASISPRKIILARPATADDKPFGIDEARKIYSGAGNVSIAASGWDLPDLKAFAT